METAILPPSTEDHKREVARRKHVLERHRCQSFNRKGFETGAKSSKGVHIPFNREDQKFIVFSTSHVHMPPIASAENAAIRVYGAFPTLGEAYTYAREFTEADADCNVQIGKSQDWILAVDTCEKLEDENYVASKRNRILEAYDNIFESEAERFKQYVEFPDKHRNGELKPIEEGCEDEEEQKNEEQKNEEEKNEEEKNEDQEQTRNMKEYNCRFPRALEVREQNYAVISIIEDANDPEREFIFIVWGCFLSEDECDGWIRDVASKHVTKYAMNVVSMYTWCRVSEMANAENVPVHYRAAELDSLMKHATQHGKDVDAFKEWCRDEKIQIPDAMEDNEIECKSHCIEQT